jgi:DNA-binding LacI/PurR family transcriptional regulator
LIFIETHTIFASKAFANLVCWLSPSPKREDFVSVIPTSKKRSTLEDVALEAQVSRATVSRVVREVPGVDREIVKRVKSAIQKTGYSANFAARALAGGKTQNVAIVFQENFGDLFMNGFWGQVLEGIHSVLEAADLQMTFLVNNDRHGKNIPRYLLNNHVDGVIFLGTSVEDKLPILLKRNNIPVVTHGEPYKGSYISRVIKDESAIGEIAAEVLIETGCKNIGAISGSSEIAASKARIDGFADGLKNRGYLLQPKAIESGKFTYGGGYEAIENLLKRNPKIDGVFVASDMMAVGALENLHRLNMRVPDDISIISCDNSPAGEFTNPKLTTIHCNPFDEGASSAKLLRDLMEGESVKSLVFPPQLKVRNTTRPIKRKIN